MVVDHGDDADDTTERQQHQAQSYQVSKPLPIVLTSQVNLIKMQWQLKGLLKGNFGFCNTRNGTRVVTKEMTDFQPSALISKTIISYTSPSVPNLRSLYRLGYGTFQYQLVQRTSQMGW
jgi:hypothetical protein